MSKDELVEVTQADRDAAWPFAPEPRRPTMATNEIVVTHEDRQAAVDAITDWQTIPFGFVDELAERFASHRIAAEQRGYERAREQAAGVAGKHYFVPVRDERDSARNATALNIATALRAQPVEHDALVERTDSSLVADMLTAAAHQPQTRTFTNAQIAEAFAALEAAATLSRQPVEADGWRAFGAGWDAALDERAEACRMAGVQDGIDPVEASILDEHLSEAAQAIRSLSKAQEGG